MSTAVRTVDQQQDDAALWRSRVREAAANAVRDFLEARCRDYLDAVPDTEVVAGFLTRFAESGKYVRSTFAVAGWECVAAPSPSAVRAAGSLELLHCFALLQDDVMDGSALRRGRPAAHTAFADWHRERGLSGSAARFGESAAVLAGDLCLVWAEQMLRESGVDPAVLARAMPRYDRMRSELAVGQFRDLVNDARRAPALADVRAVARAKSGDYTVRAPLVLGAELAGAGPVELAALGRYGDAVGEAFQLRDDLLGLFGASAVTGKPVGEDILARKATTVLVLARERADTRTRRELTRLDLRDRLTRSEVDKYLEIVERTGAREQAERLIDRRLTEGLATLADAHLDVESHARLAYLAQLCGNRNQ